VNPRIEPKIKQFIKRGKIYPSFLIKRCHMRWYYSLEPHKGSLESRLIKIPAINIIISIIYYYMDFAKVN